jgi:hypothetical protein
LADSSNSLHTLNLNDIDPKLLNYAPVVDIFEESAAASLLKDRVKMFHGQKAVKLFELGLELRSVEARAARQSYTTSVNSGWDAIDAINALNASLSEFGFQRIELKNSDDRRLLNNSLEFACRNSAHDIDQKLE